MSAHSKRHSGKLIKDLPIGLSGGKLEESKEPYPNGSAAAANGSNSAGGIPASVEDNHIKENRLISSYDQIGVSSGSIIMQNQ